MDMIRGKEYFYRDTGGDGKLVQLFWYRRDLYLGLRFDSSIVLLSQLCGTAMDNFVCARNM